MNPKAIVGDPELLNPPLLGINNDSSNADAGVTGDGGGASNPGVVGSSVHQDGVIGATQVADKHGVVGHNANGGALGSLAGSDPVFHQHAGVYGQSDQQGVMGLSAASDGTGVYGGNVGRDGTRGIGVRGETFDGVGVQGQSFGAGLAAKFIGAVEVDGDVAVSGFLNVDGDVLLTNRDISERFAVASLTGCEPGMVMVVGDDGMLTACARAHDRRVVGVISGAGTLRPAVTLGHGQHAGPDVGIALVGTAYCLVDADHGEVEVGDLLTSAPTPGYAMKAADPLQSFGAVIGKALAPLERGRSLIPIVISLQ